VRPLTRSFQDGSQVVSVFRCAAREASPADAKTASRCYLLTFASAQIPTTDTQSQLDASPGEHSKYARSASIAKQWAATQPLVEPLQITRRGDNETAVEVHQILHDLNGTLLIDESVRHIFRIENSLVTRFDIDYRGDLAFVPCLRNQPFSDTEAATKFDGEDSVKRPWKAKVSPLVEAALAGTR